jgi:hypothetical protein
VADSSEFGCQPAFGTTEPLEYLQQAAAASGRWSPAPPSPAAFATGQRRATATSLVTPADAGVQTFDGHHSIRGTWIPACAGMTEATVI